jgi:hypothetical protein
MKKLTLISQLNSIPIVISTISTNYPDATQSPLPCEGRGKKLVNSMK